MIDRGDNESSLPSSAASVVIGVLSIVLLIVSVSICTCCRKKPHRPWSSLLSSKEAKPLAPIAPPIQEKVPSERTCPSPSPSTEGQLTARTASPVSIIIPEDYSVKREPMQLMEPLGHSSSFVRGEDRADHSDPRYRTLQITVLMRGEDAKKSPMVRSFHCSKTVQAGELKKKRKRRRLSSDESSDTRSLYSSRSGKATGRYKGRA